VEPFSAVLPAGASLRRRPRPATPRRSPGGGEAVLAEEGWEGAGGERAASERPSRRPFRRRLLLASRRRAFLPFPLSLPPSRV